MNLSVVQLTFIANILVFRVRTLWFQHLYTIHIVCMTNEGTITDWLAIDEDFNQILSHHYWLVLDQIRVFTFPDQLIGNSAK